MALQKTKDLVDDVLDFRRELTRDTASWLHYECPSSLSGLLHVSVLDYGPSLLHVITKTSNCVWQLRPGLDVLNSFVFAYLHLFFLSLPLIVHTFTSVYRPPYLYSCLPLFTSCCINITSAWFTAPQVSCFYFVLFAKEVAETGKWVCLISRKRKRWFGLLSTELLVWSTNQI